MTSSSSNYEAEADVREALGEALYSRFDALIRFEPLSPTEIEQVIRRLVDDRFARLAPDEAAMLSADDVKVQLLARAGSLGNVRKLGKLVDEVISLHLVRAILGAEDDVPHTVGLSSDS